MVAGEASAQTASVLQDAPGLLERGGSIRDPGPHCAHELNAVGGRLPESRMSNVAKLKMWPSGFKGLTLNTPARDYAT